MAWRVVVLTRGLGCRPSEAQRLRWATVDLTPGRELVEWTTTKENRRRAGGGRITPVVWEWCRAALVEMKAEATGAGVVSNRGNTADHSIVAEAVRIALIERFPDYKPKRCQKLCITQMIRRGFPAHVVAAWTGHTLTMQEKHYLQKDAYLPAPKGLGHEEFGELSAYGRECLDQFRGSVG